MMSVKAPPKIVNVLALDKICRTVCAFGGDRNNAYHEIQPGLILGDATLAANITKLKKLKVTHVVNVAQHDMFSTIYRPGQNNPYEDYEIQYFGIPADDDPAFDLSPFFQPTADFIDDAIREGGTVYVHCLFGISRSTTIVVSFLMQKRRLSALDALKAVRIVRRVNPNKGFMQQLVDLNFKLYPASCENCQK